MSVSAGKCRYYAVSVGKCKHSASVVQTQCKISASKCRIVQDSAGTVQMYLHCITL